MSKTLQEVYPDPDDAICSSFFRSTDVNERMWHDITVVTDSDNQTFWTVVANHVDLSTLLRHAIAAVDNAHSSASPGPRRLVKSNDELALITFLVRIATTTDSVLRVGVNVVELSKRVGELLSPSQLMPVALMMLRHSGPAASATLTSFLLLHPVYLCAMPATATSWCDTTVRLTVRCVRDLSRGRHQRLAGDVLPLFEQGYRHVKHLWALLHCAPFIADYVPLSRVLQSLRIVVDLLLPLLQHFVLTCTALAAHRDKLSKAEYAVVNAAVNAAAVLTLFRTYNSASLPSRAHCVDRPVASTYEALSSYVLQKIHGPPAMLLANKKRPLHALLHSLVPPPEDDVEDLQVGKVLRCLAEPLPDSRDFADGFDGTRPRYFELLLLELVQQGFHIDVLLEKKFITTIEAESLGASEQTILRAIAGIVDEVVKLPSTTETGFAALKTGGGTPTSAKAAVVTEAALSPVSDNPAVNIVLDVMPHFNVEGVHAALRYYNDDVQQFILDASIDNIPPHLLAQLTAPSAQPPPFSPSSTPSPTTALPTNAPAASATIALQSQGAFTATPQTHVTSADYADEELGEVDLNYFIGGDLYDDINTSDVEGDAAYLDKDVTLGDVTFKTLRNDEYIGGAEMFAVDEAMREKIRMLTELMYEDEFDDAQEQPEIRGYERGDDSDSSPSPEKKTDSSINTLTEAGDAGATAKRGPRTEYDNKRFHETRAKQREKNVKNMKEAREGEGGPSYTRKQKTVRKKAQSNDKMAFTRAVKKGKMEW